MKVHRGLFHMLAVSVVVIQIGIVTSMFNGVAVTDVRINPQKGAVWTLTDSRDIDIVRDEQ